ncbi:MAG: hypothetical protein IPM34_14265 [Saprospiraceae bacterium]|nr:hypothetical protein [Saprospiraceae bacterium]
MKNAMILFVLCACSIQNYAQDPFPTFVAEAQEYYKQKNYKQAQMSLQDAMNELNRLMGEQLGNLLPDEINGLKAVQAAFNNAGFAGGGLALTREYKNPSKPENDADIQIMANSPLMAAMQQYMNNPAILGPGAKSIRVANLRGVLKTETIDFYGDNDQQLKIRGTQIQIPVGQTLIMFNLRGFASEQDELAFASKIDFQKIKMAAGE